MIFVGHFHYFGHLVSGNMRCSRIFSVWFPSFNGKMREELLSCLLSAWFSLSLEVADYNTRYKQTSVKRRLKSSHTSINLTFLKFYVPYFWHGNSSHSYYPRKGSINRWDGSNVFLSFFLFFIFFYFLVYFIFTGLYVFQITELCNNP